MGTELSRRTFIKTVSAATAAASAHLPILAQAGGVTEGDTDAQGVSWDKGVCRFCGVGCGNLLGSKDNKIVAIKGDPDCSVNRGLLCVKGYYNTKISYGKDRLTQPLLRMKNGEFNKQGDFVAVSWEKAFDVMEVQFKKAYKELGPAGVAIAGSGQYTIQEGYAASKLMRAGWRSNNLDPNARHCMASAVVGFIQTFGIDEPSGCYDDLELANTFVLWGSNMAEMHPILWGRVTTTRLKNNDAKIFALSTFSTPTTEMSDVEILFKPNTDIAIFNYIAREIIKKDAVDHSFVDKHCVFATGYNDIGYGLEGNDKYAFDAEKDTLAKQKTVTLTIDEAIGQRIDPKGNLTVEQKHAKSAKKHWRITFEHFKEAVEPYTLEFVAQLAKADQNESLDSFKKKLQMLADHYVSKKRDLVSMWTMGMNQHTRGSWVNESAYAVHLLTGKQAKPGNGALSLTGQPSACGTAREVGTLAHRLPADMVVFNPKHRARSEEIWQIPTGTLNPKPGGHLTKLMRGLENESIKWMWIQVTNPFQTTANANHLFKAARENDNFIVVSDIYPTLSGKVADLILPAAAIHEKWGAFGNTERRTQMWRQQVTAPGDARSDLWQMMEFSKRFTLKEVWGRQKVAGVKGSGFTDGELPNVLADVKKFGLTPDSTLFDALFANTHNKKFAWPDPISKGKQNDTAAGINWFPEKALFEEYAIFGRGHGHDLASFDTYMADNVRGLRWPVVDGKETRWRFNEKHDPYVTKGSKFDFYGKALKAIPTGNLDGITDGEKKSIKGKAKIFFRPYAAPPEIPSTEYPLWFCTGRVLEHWHSGTMTQRVPELHSAMPNALLYLHPKDAKRLKLADGKVAWIESRRGKIKALVEVGGRYKVPQGMVYLPFFDERVIVNKVTLDAMCPLSKETDFKKCAVKVYAA